jgi:NAD dependent epimerase/dehydratase
MTWKNRKALITGANGFIGSHLAETLVSLGAEVTALSSYNSMDTLGWLDDIPAETRQSMRIVRGDICDAHQMIKVCKGQDAVFHLAALITIPYSYEAPSTYVQTNVQGTTNLLQAALEGGASHFIQTSTSEAYGSAIFTPITEDHPLQGQSPYAATKIAAEKMAEAFARSFRLPVVILRPFNTFGPRQSERAVISTVIRQVLDENCEMIRLGDLRPSRDFNYVSDTVDGFIKAAGLKDWEPGDVFNLGSGRMVTIGETVDMIKAITGCDKPVVEEAQRLRPEKSEVMALMADSAKLREATNWASSVGLEDGLKLTIEWWRDRLDKARDGAGYIV